MNLKELREYLKSEEQKGFQGWDFSYLDGRWDSEGLPWDYREIISRYLKPGDRLLDMGTGGGEFLLSLGHPNHLVGVTESYPPNVQLCRERLSPLGIDVRQVYSDAELPFPDDAFDLIINRHESFEASEVNRLLKTGGYFITQQVGGRNNNDLSAKITKDFLPKYPHHSLGNNCSILKASGFEILLSEEAFGLTRFYDLGAVVYYAKIIEWEFPGFSVDTCFDKLVRLNRELDKQGFISGTEHRFVIAARKL